MLLLSIQSSTKLPTVIPMMALSLRATEGFQELVVVRVGGKLEGGAVKASTISAGSSATAVGYPLFTMTAVKAPLWIASLRDIDRKVMFVLVTIMTEDIVTPAPNSLLPGPLAATLVICISLTEMVSLIAAMVLFLKAKIKSTERAVSSDIPNISCEVIGNRIMKKDGVDLDM